MTSAGSACPRWDDAPAFSDLLGGPGHYVVTPMGRYVWGGHYEPASLIWCSRWITGTEQVVECREALARPADPRNAVLLRQAHALTGTARLEISLDVRVDAGAHPMTDLHRHGGVWTARSGPLWLRWTGAPDARPDSEGVLRGELVVPEGGHVDLVLEVGLDEPGEAPNERYAAAQDPLSRLSDDLGGLTHLARRADGDSPAVLASGCRDLAAVLGGLGEDVDDRARQDALVQCADEIVQRLARTDAEVPLDQAMRMVLQNVAADVRDAARALQPLGRS